MAPQGMEGVFLLGSEGEGDTLTMDVTYSVTINTPIQRLFPGGPPGVVMYDLRWKDFGPLKKALMTRRTNIAKKAFKRCHFLIEEFDFEEKWYVVWKSGPNGSREEIKRWNWEAVRTHMVALAKAKDESGDDAVDCVRFHVDMRFKPAARFGAALRKFKVFTGESASTPSLWNDRDRR